MNPFKSDPEKELARDLDAARASHAKLIDRLTTAEAAVAEKRAAAQRLARDGADDVDLDQAEAALRSAQDRVGTLSAARDEAAQQISELERTIAELADRKVRAATAKQIEQLALELEKAGTAFEAAAAKLVEATKQIIDAGTLDAMGLQNFALSASTETPNAVAMIAQVLRDQAAAVISGNAAAELPKPPPPPSAEVVVLPPPQQPQPKPVRYYDPQRVEYQPPSGQQFWSSR